MDRIHTHRTDPNVSQVSKYAVIMFSSCKPLHFILTVLRSADYDKSELENPLLRKKRASQKIIKQVDGGKETEVAREVINRKRQTTEDIGRMQKI
jgi:hypothetical protein